MDHPCFSKALRSTDKKRIQCYCIVVDYHSFCHMLPHFIRYLHYSGKITDLSLQKPYLSTQFYCHLAKMHQLLDLSHILPQILPQILPCFAKITRLFLFVTDFSMFLSQIVLQTLILFENRPAQLARQESFDLQGARRLVDEDHRGLEKVRIIQRLGHLIVVYSVNGD